MAVPPNERRCTARSKQTGERCAEYVAVQVIRARHCHIHGGREELDPHGGRPPEHYLYSRHLKNPEDLAAYEYHKANPEILNLNADIALARTNLGRFLEACQGPMTAEVRSHIMQHHELISKLVEREAKRQHNEQVVSQLLAKQVQAEAAILQRVLSKYVDTATAERAASEFADLVAAESSVSASVQVGG